MILQDLVDGIKRDSQSGEVGNNSDLAASDIIRHFNQASADFWEFDDWDWSLVDINFTLPANTTAAQLIDSTVGRLIVLGVQGVEGDLAILSQREYRKRRNSDSNGSSQSQAGVVWAAVMRGRDATTGSLKVLFAETPASDTVIEGEGKARISEYAVADIPTLGQIPYFPKEVHPLLYDWVYGRYLTSIKDERGAAVLQSLLGPDGKSGRIRALSGKMKSQPADQVTTPPPDYIRFGHRRRGGRTVV